MIFLKENEYNKEKNIKIIKIKDILLLINNIKNSIIKQKKNSFQKKIKQIIFYFLLKQHLKRLYLKFLLYKKLILV